MGSWSCFAGWLTVVFHALAMLLAIFVSTSRARPRQRVRVFVLSCLVGVTSRAYFGGTRTNIKNCMQGQMNDASLVTQTHVQSALRRISCLPVRKFACSVVSWVCSPFVLCRNSLPVRSLSDLLYCRSTKTCGPGGCWCVVSLPCRHCMLTDTQWEWPRCREWCNRDPCKLFRPPITPTLWDTWPVIPVLEHTPALAHCILALHGLRTRIQATRHPDGKTTFRFCFQQAKNNNTVFRKMDLWLYIQSPRTS